MKKLMSLLLFCAFFGVVALSQNESKSDAPKSITVVTLKNGSVLEGELLEYDAEGALKLRLANGVIVTFLHTQIDHLKHRYLGGRGAKPYAFRESGYYFHSSLSSSFERDVYDDLVPAVGLEQVAGYQFSRWIGAGLGAGLHTMNAFDGPVFIPVFAEARGYFLKKRVSPYYAMQLGYAFPLTSSGQNLLKARGGMLLHPAAGFRFGGSEHLNFTLDFGIRFILNTKLTYEEELFWSSSIEPSIVELDKSYIRSTLRFGLLF
jgi:hypothetical protein